MSLPEIISHHKNYLALPGIEAGSPALQPMAWPLGNMNFMQAINISIRNSQKIPCASITKNSGQCPGKIAIHSEKKKCITLRGKEIEVVNPLKPELNPSAQRCLTRFFTGDFVS
jgi:hypothetical protein